MIPALRRLAVGCCRNTLQQRHFSGRALANDHSVFSVEKRDGRGRCMLATRVIEAGEVVHSEEPIVAVADPFSSSSTCALCFRGVAASACHCPKCSELYCSPACRALAASVGHSILCGNTANLDAFCREQRANFPRVAAAMLARSFSGHASVDFGAYWTSISHLASTAVAADTDGLPLVWRRGYEQVKGAVGASMTQGADAFFATAFDLRTYARLMGTLRLNSFSVQCPLGASEPGHQSSGGGSGSDAARVAGARPSRLLQPAALPPLADSNTAAAAAAGSCGGGGGGDSTDCSSRASTTDGGGSGCCSSSSDDGSDAAAADALEVRGGTALYAAASYANHDCEPNMDVMMGPAAALRYVARRRVGAGEELTITYLDSALPATVRRGKLAHGYGFECACALCTRQMTQVRAERAAEARREWKLQLQQAQQLLQEQEQR